MLLLVGLVLVGVAAAGAGYDAENPRNEAAENERQRQWDEAWR